MDPPFALQLSHISMAPYATLLAMEHRALRTLSLA
jgi:hypothetical protein